MTEQEFCKQRMQMFADKTTFWGYNRMDVAMLEPVMDFPDDAYHNIPFADVDFRAMLLKRRYLNRLRLKLIKLNRQRCAVGDYVGRYYVRKNSEQIKQHINSDREARIAAYREFQRQYYGETHV